MLSCHASRIALPFPQRLASGELPRTPFTGNSGDQTGGAGRSPFLYMEAVAQPAACGFVPPIATSKMRISWWDTAQVPPSPYARRWAHRPETHHQPACGPSSQRLRPRSPQ